MTTKIELTYCGMPGEGATVKLAKQDAARKIEAVLDGYYTPTMIRHAGMIGFVWREPTGYCYKIVGNDTESGPLHGNSSSQDERETRSNCARHMAQLAGTHAGLERYITDAYQRELDQYFAWQDRYRVAKATGMTDAQAHEAASQSPVK